MAKNLAYLFAIYVLLFNFPLANAGVSFQNNPLIYSNDFKNLNSYEQEKYLDALREFFNQRQEDSPTYSFYFLDALMGKHQALARAYSVGVGSDRFKDCDTAIFQNVNSPSDLQIIKKDQRCMGRFASLLEAGTLGTCRRVDQQSYAGDASLKSFAVSCTTKEYDSGGKDNVRRWVFYDLPSKDQNYINKAIDKNPNKTGARYLTPKEADESIKNQSRQSGSSLGADDLVVNKEKKSNSELAVTGAVTAKTPEKKADSAESEKSKKPETARCFYAGYIIKRNDKGQIKCAGVTDACSDKLSLRGQEQSDIKEVLGCGQSPQKIKSTCGDSKSPLANQVVCNPLLYGVSGKDPNKSVLCVRRSKSASSDCADLMKKDADTKKNLDELLKSANGKKSFDSLVKEIEHQCSPYWNFTAGAAHNIKDSDLKTRSNKNEAKSSETKAGTTPQGKPKKAIVPKPGEVKTTTADTADNTKEEDPYERSNDNYKGDFQKTCQILLNQAGEVKRSVLGSTGAATTTPSGQPPIGTGMGAK